VGNIIKKGKRAPGRYVSFFYERCPKERSARVAFTTTRGARLAVERNRLRRLMRETFRLNMCRLRSAMEELGCGVDIVMYATNVQPNVSLKDIEGDFEKFILKFRGTITK
jgi:ribonuclease P protein component